LINLKRILPLNDVDAQLSDWIGKADAEECAYGPVHLHLAGSSHRLARLPLGCGCGGRRFSIGGGAARLAARGLAAGGLAARVGGGVCGGLGAHGCDAKGSLPCGRQRLVLAECGESARRAFAARRLILATCGTQNTAKI